ncbi:MAG: PAS domain S-box protein [Leptolyngbya sp. BL-A-14]
MNYLHKYYLDEAEKARVSGQFLEAEEFYERAIAGAAEQELIQEEALAYELAAKHYLARGRAKIAQTYMKEAHYCYDRWGANAKVKDLETCYPHFFSQPSRVACTSISTPSETTSNRLDSDLDLAAVIKASQAISREIELEQLLRSLMQILIENAGAQIGYLILENSGEWRIEAACELAEGETVCATQVLQSIPTANQLPESIIQYVIRTQESVILNDATREGNFIHEPYIQQHQTKSIFCLPLLNQAKLVGVLYLENQLAVGAFTPERSQILNLLSTQAAIAIENAKLYAKLRKSKDKITQFLEAVPVGIAVADVSGRPTYFNQRAIQLLGQEPDPSVTPEQAAEAYQVYLAGTDQKYPTEKLPMIQALSGEHTHSEDMEIRRNNATIPVETWGTPVFDKQGNVICAIAAFQDITERKQAEKLLADYNLTLEQQVAERTAALQASEAELRALFSAIPDSLCVISAEGRVFEKVEENPKQVYRLIEEMVGKTLHQIFEKEQADKFLSYIQQTLRTQQVLTVEYSLWIAGREIWLSARIAPIRHDQVIWLARDITLQKQAEAALRQSEAKFRAIFENSQVGIYRTRLSDGLILDANQCYANLFGFDSPAELIGIRYATDFYMNPDDRDRVVELLQRNGELQNFEVQKLKRDGTSFWGLYSYHLNTTDGYIEGVVADISDRKQAEAALRDVYDRLHLREQELRLITDALPALICYVDANQRYQFVNQTYEVWFKRSRNEILGKTVREVLGEAAYQIAAPNIKRALEGQVSVYEAEMPYPFDERYYRGTFIPDFGADAQVKGYYGLITDISDRKRAEEVLRQSKAQFREQAILSAFRADVNSALAQSDGLPVMLQRCAEAVVKHFDAAFTRIWTISQDQTILELQASAGMYARLDGTYSRISINSKRIVREGTPRLINNLFDDETFVDQEWAQREGLVAFAGYPILLDEQLVGMVAMFARQPIPVSHFEALGFAAREMALGIKRKQAEVALQASETELRTLIAAIPDPLYVISAEGQIIEAVAVEPDLRCHPIEGMIGKTLHQLGEKQADEFLGYIQQVLRTQQILTVEYSDFLNGREIWLSARIAPFRHKQVIWLTRDITALKQAEQASILEERNRMAREIHDTLAQAFTGILIQVDAATQVLTDDAEATLAHLDTIEELARTGLTEARRSVTALRPQLLEDGDLSSALERLVNQMRVATNTALICSIQGTAYSLPAEVENNLLRIGQEALTNAIKYANANEIRIKLVYDDAQCRLQVRDDGQGFGVVGVPMSGGFGLLGMSERAEHIGAHLTIESQPGQGTEIIVIVNRG